MQKARTRLKALRTHMKNKYTKEQVEEAYLSLMSNQSLIKTIVGAALGLVSGIIIYLLFGLMGATITLFLFFPPAIVGYLAGVLGKPYEIKLKLIVAVFGMLTYFIGLYWIFIAHNVLLILLTPIAGFIATFCSGLHITELQKRAIWKKQYE